MADQHFVLLGGDAWRRRPRYKKKSLAFDARQQKVPLQRDAEIGLAVAVDVTGDDGVAAAEQLAQLALHTGEVANANEGEVVVASAATLGIDAGKVDLVAALGEIGDQVALRALNPAVRECHEYEEIGARTAGKNIPAPKSG